MDRTEMIKLASPPCHECQAPVQSVEIPMKLQGLDWVPNGATMVCVNGCRVRIEPF